MAKKILFLQFRTDQSEKHELELMAGNLSEFWGDVEVVNLLRNPELVDGLNLDDYSCVLLGGSGEADLSKYGEDERLTEMMDRLRPFMQQVIDQDKPTLGICLGMGLIAWTMGSKILNGDSGMGEVGSSVVKKTEAAEGDKLLGCLPGEFIGQHGHKEAVESLPDGVKLTLTSDVCPIQGFRVKENIYGVQFHPELTKADWLDRAALYETHHGEYGYDTEQDDVKMNMKESPEALALLKRFLLTYQK